MEPNEIMSEYLSNELNQKGFNNQNITNFTGRFSWAFKRALEAQNANAIVFIMKEMPVLDENKQKSKWDLFFVYNKGRKNIQCYDITIKQGNIITDGFSRKSDNHPLPEFKKLLERHQQLANFNLRKIAINTDIFLKDLVNRNIISSDSARDYQQILPNRILNNTKPQFLKIKANSQDENNQSPVVNHYYKFVDNLIEYRGSVVEIDNRKFEIPRIHRLTPDTSFTISLATRIKKEKELNTANKTNAANLMNEIDSGINMKQNKMNL